MSSEATTLTVAMRQMNNPEKYWAFSQKKMVRFGILLIDAARTSRRKYHRSMQNSLTNTFHDVEDSRTLRGCLKSPEMSVFDRWRALLKGHLHCPKSSEINDAYFHMDTSHAAAETFQTASKGKHVALHTAQRWDWPAAAEAPDAGSRVAGAGFYRHCT